MRRRAFLRGLSMAAAAAWLPGTRLPAGAADAGPICPRCGAPLDPGAAFCGRCGLKLDKSTAAAAPGTDRRGAVVQLVTVHDADLTSTLQSLAYESNVRVDSLLGSAFAVAPGEFVTDAGLLVGTKEITLRAAGGRSVPARLVGTDPMIGVALVESDLKDTPVLPLRDREAARLGEGLDAMGYPNTLQGSGEPVVSTGVISGLPRSAARIHPIEDSLQTDASLPRGFAGGPMIDPQGRVVGMCTGWVLGGRVALGQSGLGLAVPADWLAKGLAYIRSGSPPRAVRERFKLSPDVKLLVDQVFPGSPAESAGILRGDALLKVRNDECAVLSRLQETLLGMKAGESLEVEIRRGQETRRLTLTLAVRPERPRLSGVDALRFFGGVEIVPQGDDRLVVTHVPPGSEMAHLRIAEGDVLQSVLSKKDWLHGAKDNSRWRSVHSVADLEERLATAYSDLDFCLGLRFKSKDGTKREMLLWEILTPTPAI